MKNLTFTLPDHMADFLQTVIGPGKFPSVDAYPQYLIAEDMQNYEIAFTDE